MSFPCHYRNGKMRTRHSYNRVVYSQYLCLTIKVRSMFVESIYKCGDMQDVLYIYASILYWKHSQDQN